MSDEPSPLHVVAEARPLRVTLIELWQFRRFIIGSVLREFRSRYTRSLLGSGWLLLAPFAMILVYTLVFAGIMQARLPGNQEKFAYSIFLCAGLLPWQWMNELISRCANIFIDHAGLIKKASFPRMALPVIAFLSSTINFLIVFLLFVLFLVLLDRWPGSMIVHLAPLFALQCIFAACLGLTLGILNVFFRDVGQALGIVMQFWFWFTPIVYPVATLPDTVVKWLAWNPLLPLFDSYQKVLLGIAPPLWESLFPLIALTFFCCGLAIVFYRGSRAQLADEL